MSFVRFGEDGSDVYIYDDIDFGFYCAVCELEGAICGQDYDAMLRHIELHKQNGDHVPDFVSEALIEERDNGGWRYK